MIIPTLQRGNDQRSQGPAGALDSGRQVDHPAILGVQCRAASVDHQFADPDQQRAGDIAAQAQQAGGVNLIAIGVAVGGAQQLGLDLFIQVAMLLLEQFLEGFL